MWGNDNQIQFYHPGCLLSHFAAGKEKEVEENVFQEPECIFHQGKKKKGKKCTQAY